MDTSATVAGAPPASKRPRRQAAAAAQSALEQVTVANLDGAVHHRMRIALTSQDTLEDKTERDAVFRGRPWPQSSVPRTLVVTLYTSQRPKNLPKGGYNHPQHVGCPFDDSEKFDEDALRRTLDSMVMAIDEARECTRVLFVCQAGINRSSLALCYYCAASGQAGCSWRDAKRALIEAKGPSATGWPTLSNTAFEAFLVRRFERERPGASELHASSNETSEGTDLIHQRPMSMPTNEGTDLVAAVEAVAAYARQSAAPGESSLAAPPLSLVAGRVCRGANAEAFETLHPDGLTVKPISWVVGEEGLAMLLGAAHVDERTTPPLHQSVNRAVNEERLTRLGFERRWIRKKIAAGERFRLALFPAEAAVPATWEGVFRVVRETFPAVAPKVLRPQPIPADPSRPQPTLPLAAVAPTRCSHAPTS